MFAAFWVDMFTIATKVLLNTSEHWRCHLFACMCLLRKLDTKAFGVIALLLTGPFVYFA